MISTFLNSFSLIEKKLKKKLILIYFLSAIGTFLETLGIGIILPILKIIIDGNYTSSLSLFFSKSINFFLNNKIVDKNYLINLLFIFAIIIFFLKIIFFSFLINLQTKFSFLVESELSKKFFNYYLNQEYLFHLKKNSAELFSNITEEIKNFKINLVDAFLVFSTEVIFLIVISILLFVIDPLVYTIVIFFTFIIAMIYLRFTKKQILDSSNKRQFNEILKVQYLREGLNSIKEIKIARKEKEILSIFNKHNIEIVKARAKLGLITSIPRFLLEFVGITGISILAIVLINKGVDLRLLIPTLGVFVVAIFRILPSTARLLQSVGRIRFGVSSINTLIKELKEQTNSSSKNDEIHLEKLEFKNLKLQNIVFKYPGSEKKILNRINLEVNNGDKIGIMGKTGSGKSTIADILAGLINPLEGNILLQNKIVNLNNKNWYKFIGYVPQSIFLSDDTILNNIIFSKQDGKIEMDRVKQVCKIAELDEFIKNKIDGLNTRVGEFGLKLSGGQRQRIGIARALYLNADILIFDESTSAIDSDTELKIIRNINLLKNKTTIIISHRTSTLKNCDKIYQLDNGNLFKIDI